MDHASSQPMAAHPAPDAAQPHSAVRLGLGSSAIAAGRWLAFLRIAVGAWFVKSVGTKFGFHTVGDVLPIPGASERWVGFMPTRVAEYAVGNPLEPYRWFLAEVVLPNTVLFAHLTAFGEAVIGAGLVLGLFTRYAAAVGLLVSTSYFLATFWMSPGQMGFHLLLMACMIAFAGSAAGRVWGLDGLLSRHRPGYRRLTTRLRAA